MDQQSLRIFAEVVAQGGFAAAARALDLDPSAVSRAVAALEAELSLRLFERTTRRVALTEAGRVYFDRIAPLLTDLDAAAEAARALVQAPRGVLRVSASTAFGQVVLVPLLAGFRAAYSEIKLQLMLSDIQVDMVADGIDVAIRMSPEAPPDTLVTRLMPTRYRVVAAPGYLREHQITAPGDLARHDVLAFPYPGFRDLWRARLPEGDLEVPVRAGIEIAGAMALRQAALEGLGPTLLADWLIVRDLEMGRLIDPFDGLAWTATGFDTSAWLLYPSRAYLPAKTRVFIDHLRAGLG